LRSDVLGPVLTVDFALRRYGHGICAFAVLWLYAGVAWHGTSKFSTASLITREAGGLYICVGVRWMFLDWIYREHIVQVHNGLHRYMRLLYPWAIYAYVIFYRPSLVWLRQSSWTKAYKSIALWRTIIVYLCVSVVT